MSRVWVWKTAGACSHGHLYAGCGCPEFEGQVRRPDGPQIPRHDGCVCYWAEEEAIELDENLALVAKNAEELLIVERANGLVDLCVRSVLMANDSKLARSDKALVFRVLAEVLEEDLDGPDAMVKAFQKLGEEPPA